jgi:vacuolar protein sorting-associated protein 11
LYSYAQTERIGVSPIDGTKLALCLIPPPIPAEQARRVDDLGTGTGYALVASKDSKSGRDAVDIYDSTNKLVALHLLLSPGHRALRAAGVTTPPSTLSDGSLMGGKSAAIVFTSGGQLLALTEKATEEKINLLVQKYLFSAAIMVAYADPSLEATYITTLYRRYAEHLYRKGDFTGAMEQYMHTIGSLESSHVIFRFLDAPKIPLLVQYLEKLRSRDLATPVHNELLRTCYLKLNDTTAAEAIASSSNSIDKASLTSILSNLVNNPKDALATICSLDAQQAAEILVIHGASLARMLPRETAGVVISLCVGTYSPKALADASALDTTDLNKMIQYATDDREKTFDPYPVHLFASAFIEHPKMLRLVLAHCNRNKCVLTSSLRRTLLELTLAEWNQAKRCGDTEAEKLRHKEAVAVCTD